MITNYNLVECRSAVGKDSGSDSLAETPRQWLAESMRFSIEVLMNSVQQVSTTEREQTNGNSHCDSLWISPNRFTFWYKNKVLWIPGFSSIVTLMVTFLEDRSFKWRLVHSKLVQMDLGDYSIWIVFKTRIGVSNESFQVISQRFNKASFDTLENLTQWATKFTS